MTFVCLLLIYYQYCAKTVTAIVIVRDVVVEHLVEICINNLIILIIIIIIIIIGEECIISFLPS